MTITSVEMKIQYEAGHSYLECWEPVEIFCPSCGAATIWHERSEGDYEVGELYLCVRCTASFTIQGPQIRTGSWQDAQRITVLRATCES